MSETDKRIEEHQKALDLPPPRHVEGDGAKRYEAMCTAPTDRAPKPGPLTDAEFAELKKTNPVVAARYARAYGHYG